MSAAATMLETHPHYIAEGLRGVLRRAKGLRTSLHSMHRRLPRGAINRRVDPLYHKESRLCRYLYGRRPDRRPTDRIKL
jgi:hypothetical protein